MADRRSDDNGQGDVKNPATDGRLKENREGSGYDASLGEDGEDDDRQPGGQGRVTDSETDGRLSDNR